MLHLILAATTFAAEPCQNRAMGARCEVMTVAENRTTMSGRTIGVHYKVIPATTSTSKEPLFLIEGGPGQSAIDDAVGFASLAAPHHDRDVVVIDQRGTGLSHDLPCNFYPDGAASTYQFIFPPKIIATCRAQLAATSDLDAYGTDAAMDDLNDIRAHLGYKKIVLVGGSYGTTAALVYIRRHGDTVAAAVMSGVATPWQLGPLGMARGAQNALGDLESSCSGDPACSKAFPRFSAEVDSLLASAKQRGIAVKDGVISFDVLVERIRDALYGEQTAARLPLIVHRAISGDTKPLADMVSSLSLQIPGSLSLGMNLSITCAENMAFITPADVARSTAGTFMGDARLREQLKACAIWNVKPADKSFLDPIRSDVPVLMISGGDDPATPPRYGAEEVKYLTNGRQVIVPQAGHFTEGPCTYAITMKFLATYDAKSIDTSCLKAAVRPPFAVEP